MNLDKLPFIIDILRGVYEREKDPRNIEALEVVLDILEKIK